MMMMMMMMMRWTIFIVWNISYWELAGLRFGIWGQLSKHRAHFPQHSQHTRHAREVSWLRTFMRRRWIASSLKKLRDLCFGAIDDGRWFADLDSTNWLKHIKVRRGSSPSSSSSTTTSLPVHYYNYNYSLHVIFLFLKFSSFLPLSTSILLAADTSRVADDCGVHWAGHLCAGAL